MRSSHTLPIQRTAFDDPRLIADAGLLLPATLARRLGLAELLERHVDLGRTAGRAHVADKGLALIMSALAGGDCIDDVDALRAGATAAVLGHRVAAPSTVGTFLRAFRWGHARQLDAVGGELLRRAWAASAGPGDDPLTIDIDSTIRQTHGLYKHGGRSFTHTGVRGYHPLLAVRAGTDEVLHHRLRGGNAAPQRGAASFTVETIIHARQHGSRSRPLSVPYAVASAHSRMPGMILGQPRRPPDSHSPAGSLTSSILSALSPKASAGDASKLPFHH